jgi:hypothetical protein
MTPKPVTVVYDTRHGEIVLIHDWSTYEGVELPNESQREKDAIDVAVGKTGRQRSEFATLHAQAKDIEEEGVEYKVDVQKKSLVVKDRKPRKVK